MIRLFTALELPVAVRERLAGLAGGVPGARWTAPENMHLTLRFIGDISEDLADEAAAALETVRAPAFDLVIEGAGSFSRGRKPSMIWAGVAKNDALLRLQQKIESALVRAGLPPDARKYMPHVTLARLGGSPRARVEDFVAAHALLRLAPIRCGHFALFSSFRGGEGAIYTREAVYPLAGA